MVTCFYMDFLLLSFFVSLPNAGCSITHCVKLCQKTVQAILSSQFQNKLGLSVNVQFDAVIYNTIWNSMNGNTVWNS